MASSRLRIRGAWDGVLELDFGTFTVGMLRVEVHRRSGAGPDQAISMICDGKLLKDTDGAETLSRLGIKSNAKVLATAVAADRDLVDRWGRLTRLRAAVAALAERHAYGSLPVEDFSLELEDQSGKKVMLGSELDKKGVMTGLMLHATGKSLIRKHKYKDALAVLIMGEEAFALCDPKFIEMFDNVPMLQLDIVWCYFMLRDISWLSVAGVELLTKARKGFERAHGKDSTRFRNLQAGCHVELAIYLRLELLEGVFAYHSGKYEESRKALSSAQSKYFQLQVPNEALTQLMNWGYTEKSAKRALIMSGQDIQNAIDVLNAEVKERAKKTHVLNAEVKERAKKTRRFAVTKGTSVAAASGDDAAAPSTAAAASPENDRDEEVENEIAKELTQDAMTDYDIEVSKEGEAIAGYLSILDSTGNVSIGSS